MSLGRTWRAPSPARVLGIRRDESPARAQTPEFKPDERYARPGNANGTEMMLWHPIVGRRPRCSGPTRHTVSRSTRPIPATAARGCHAERVAIRVANRADALLRRRLEAELPTGLRYIKGWPPRIPTHPEAALIAASRSQILARHGLADLYATPDAVRDRFADLMAARKAA